MREKCLGGLLGSSCCPSILEVGVLCLQGGEGTRPALWTDRCRDSSVTGPLPSSAFWLGLRAPNRGAAAEGTHSPQKTNGSGKMSRPLHAKAVRAFLESSPASGGQPLPPPPVYPKGGWPSSSQAPGHTAQSRQSWTWTPAPIPRSHSSNPALTPTETSSEGSHPGSSPGDTVMATGHWMCGAPRTEPGFHPS